MEFMFLEVKQLGIENMEGIVFAVEDGENGRNIIKKNKNK